MREKVIEYLAPLLQENGFRRLGPHSWLFEDARDQLLVYINQSNLVLVHDGPSVVDGMEMHQLLPDVEDEGGMNSLYLQPILHRF